jgi:hypothetical protein
MITNNVTGDVPSLASIACRLAEVISSTALHLEEGVGYFACELPPTQQWELITTLASLGSQCRALTQRLATPADDAEEVS